MAIGELNYLINIRFAMQVVCCMLCMRMAGTHVNAVKMQAQIRPGHYA
jgi:hypothetical protein